MPRSLIRSPESRQRKRKSADWLILPLHLGALHDGHFVTTAVEAEAKPFEAPEVPA
jgi:hypothetical protein